MRAVTKDTTFDAACALIEAALGGARRAELLEGLTLPRLRDYMRSNSFEERFVRRFDAETRREGFHVLHDWDGKADKVGRDIIPIDVLGYLIDTRGAGPHDEPGRDGTLDVCAAGDRGCPGDSNADFGAGARAVAAGRDCRGH